MTRKLPNGDVVIASEKPRVCDRCKEERECRDVLGNGSSLCFSCTTDEERESYGKRLFG